MRALHPLGTAALVLTGALLSACGDGSPTITPATAAGASALTTSRAPSPPERGGERSGQRSDQQQPGAVDPGPGQTVRSSVDTIEVSKCYTNATDHSAGQMLIKAHSSDPSARLLAYRPDGAVIGEIQNGDSSRYGGTVISYQPRDPVNVTVWSSAGGTTTVPTAPYPADN